MPQVILELDAICTDSVLYKVNDSKKDSFYKFMQNPQGKSFLNSMSDLVKLCDENDRVGSRVVGLCPYNFKTKIIVKSCDDQGNLLANSVEYKSARNENYSSYDGPSLKASDLSHGLYVHVQKIGRVPQQLAVQLDKKPIRAKTMVKDVYEKHSQLTIPSFKNEKTITDKNPLIYSFIWNGKDEFKSKKTGGIFGDTNLFAIEDENLMGHVIIVFEVASRKLHLGLFQKTMNFCHVAYIYNDFAQDNKELVFDVLNKDKNYYVNPITSIKKHFNDEGIKLV